MSALLHFDTQQHYAGQEPDLATNARVVPIHPASTTRQQLSEQEQSAAGVEPGMLRISAGIDHIDDIKADLEQAFVQIAEPVLT